MDPAEALDLLGGGLNADEVNPLTGYPLISVSMDHGEDLEQLVRITRDSECVVIGVDRNNNDVIGILEPSLARGFDVLLTARTSPPAPWVGLPDADRSLEQITSAIGSSPAAALSLVQLLRSSETMAMHDALVAESWVYSMLQSGPEFHEWLGRRDPRV
jgi:hypothetical protein